MTPSIGPNVADGSLGGAARALGPGKGGSVPEGSEPSGQLGPADKVELGNQAPEASGDAEFQKRKRMGTNATLLVLGDVPAGISIAVGLDMLPGLTPFSDVINAFNSLTGYLGLASDLSVARDCISNPEAKKVDKVVDAAHIGSDLINTGASMVPLFTSLSNPIALGVFIGGQALGAACDLAKSIWDYKRGGQQSSRSDADQPQRLVLDDFEKKAGRLPFLVGTLAANSMAFPHAGVHVISAALAQPLTALGGAFGGVYGFTQVKKSRQLLKQLRELKAQGGDEFEMPRWSRQAVQTYTLQMDKAIAQVKRRELTGWGQMAGSALLMAAGCAGFAPLAVAGMLVSTAVGVTAVGAELYVNRQEIKEKLVHGLEVVKEKAHHLKEKAGQAWGSDST